MQRKGKMLSKTRMALKEQRCRREERKTRCQLSLVTLLVESLYIQAIPFKHSQDLSIFYHYVIFHFYIFYRLNLVLYDQLNDIYFKKRSLSISFTRVYFIFIKFPGQRIAFKDTFFFTNHIFTIPIHYRVSRSKCNFVLEN